MRRAREPALNGFARRHRAGGNIFPNDAMMAEPGALDPLCGGAAVASLMIEAIMSCHRGRVRQPRACKRVIERQWCPRLEVRGAAAAPAGPRCIDPLEYLASDRRGIVCRRQVRARRQNHPYLAATLFRAEILQLRILQRLTVVRRQRALDFGIT